MSLLAGVGRCADDDTSVGHLSGARTVPAVPCIDYQWFLIAICSHDSGPMGLEGLFKARILVIHHEADEPLTRLIYSPYLNFCRMSTGFPDVFSDC